MKKIMIYCRAMRLARMGRDAYNAAVYSCANLSRLDHKLAFQVHKWGPFGFPIIEQTTRPDVAVCVENMRYVVVKDGNIFEMQKWL